MTEPEFLITDFAKFERPAQLHIAYQVLHKYIDLKGSPPKPYCKVTFIYLSALKLDCCF